MSIKLEERRLRVEELVGEEVATITAEGTLEIPAHQPDVQRVLRFRALPAVASTKVVDERVVVSGTVAAHLLYVANSPDDSAAQEPVFAADAREAIEFEHTFDMPGLAGGDEVEAAASVISTQARTTADPRQAALEVDLEIAVKVRRASEVTIVTNALAIPPEKIRLTREPLRLEQAIGSGATLYNLQFEAALPERRADIARLLDLDVRPSLINATAEVGQVTLRGEAHCGATYTSVDSAARENGASPESINYVAFDAQPFICSIEMPDAQPGMIVYPRVALVRATTSVPSARQVSISATLALGARLVDPLSLHAITDVASDTEETIETRKEAVTVEDVLGRNADRTAVTGKLDLPAARPDADRILSWDVQFRRRNVEVKNEKVVIEGVLSASVLYIADVPLGTQPLQFVEFPEAIDATIVVDLKGVEPEMAADASASVLSSRVDLVDQDTFQVNAVVEAEVRAKQNKQTDLVVEAVAIGPVPERPPSIVLVSVQPGDTLWKLSRRFRTSADAILRANGLAEGASLRPGMKLRIR